MLYGNTESSCYSRGLINSNQVITDVGISTLRRRKCMQKSHVERQARLQRKEKARAFCLTPAVKYRCKQQERELCTTYAQMYKFEPYAKQVIENLCGNLLVLRDSFLYLCFRCFHPIFSPNGSEKLFTKD